MKNLFIALALLFSIQLAAQPKEVTDALKALEKAKKESENVKKTTNPATWLKLSEAYTAVYDAPIKSLWLGASRLELKVLLKDQRIINTETRKILDQDFSVDSYEDKDLFYSQDGTLASWIVTKKYYEGDPLGEAFSALNKAAEVDTKSAKTKEISDQLIALKNRYQNSAMSAYALGDYKMATDNFAASLNVSSHNLVKQVDTVIMYYTGLTANMSKDYDRAVEYFKKAIDNGYDAKGDAYSYLTEAYKGLKDMDKAKEALSAGFEKYPTNQSILVSLINIYLESNDDPNKILDLIKKAQENEPTNASLYYAEGNVWKNLKDVDKAIACYSKSVEIDPNYYFGTFAMGAAYYDRAVEIQVKASEEIDDTKYEILVKQLEENLNAAINPFEACFATSTDDEVKAVVAEYLKNIYFRFREKSETFKAGYEKYNSYLESKK
ncbi:MAG: tetratricopeptide repeat protein [Rikenellaceae bacterium]